MRQYTIGTGIIVALQFTPGGESLLCVEGGKERWSGHWAVHRLDSRTGTLAHTLDLCEPAWRKSNPFANEVETGRAFVSADGLWVAVQRHLGDPILLDLWNGRTGKWREVKIREEHLFCVDAAVFSPDPKLLVFASGTDGGGTFKLERMQVKTGRRLPSIDFPGETVRQLVFSLAGRLLAALTYGGVYVYQHHQGEVDSDRAIHLEIEVEERLRSAFGLMVRSWPSPTTTRFSSGTAVPVRRKHSSRPVMFSSRI